MPGSAPAVYGEQNFISAHSYLRLVVGNIFERFSRPKMQIDCCKICYTKPCPKDTCMAIFCQGQLRVLASTAYAFCSVWIKKIPTTKMRLLCNNCIFYAGILNSHELSLLHNSADFYCNNLLLRFSKNGTHFCNSMAHETFRRFEADC